MISGTSLDRFFTADTPGNRQEVASPWFDSCNLLLLLTIERQFICYPAIQVARARSSHLCGIELLRLHGTLEERSEGAAGAEAISRRWVGLASSTLAALSVTVIVVVGTLRARGETAISQWVMWVAVATLVVTLIGAIPGLWDRFVKAKDVPAERVRDTEDELAAVVLVQTQKARSLLIGADEAGDRAANVQFIKGAGHFREVGGSKEGDLASVLEYYQSLSPRRLVVLGDPGAGKTVLTMELLIRLLEQRQHDKSGPVPVLISAAAYDAEFAWEDWLARHLTPRFAIDEKVAKKLVRDGRILPMVDGVDEMDLANEPKQANALIAALNSSIHARGQRRGRGDLPTRRVPVSGQAG